MLASSAVSSGDEHLARLRRRAQSFMRTLGLSGRELSLTLVGDAQMRRLNRQWRGKDRATDVLSFPSGDFVGPGPSPLGDVIISMVTARRAAKTYQRTLAQELDRYLAHGLLHLLGYDHHRRADAAAMARLEAKLLGGRGML